MEEESINQQIQDIISSLNFKESNTINFDQLTEHIQSITGNKPSIIPKWKKVESANEDRVLDGSNKIVEKITKVKIAYLNAAGFPVSLEFLV